MAAGFALVAVGCGGAKSDAALAAEASAVGTLSAGTSVEITIRDGISSRSHEVGTVINASVSQDVLDDKGRVAIPAGSPVAVHISEIAPSDKGDHSGEGVLVLSVTSLSVHGVSHDANAVVRAIPHTMKGRGITPGVAGTLAGGTAIGAIAGQAIGKNTKSTVVGGAVGAVAGGAVAVAGAQRDIVVAPGTRVTFSLSEDLSVSSK